MIIIALCLKGHVKISCQRQQALCCFRFLRCRTAHFDFNKIEDRIQEDLLKWKEAYHAAQVDINVTSRYTVPAPTKNPYWENLKLSCREIFSRR